MTGRNHGAKRFHSHPAHPPPVRRHNQPTILYVTVCTVRKTDVLANDDAHAALVKTWRNATHWLVGHYLLMPDHVHLFCAPGIHEAPGIRRWVGYWKRLSGDVHQSLKGAFQEDCWDTQMRTREQYDEKLSYVMMNPVRKGLADDPESWPYRGKVHDVHWT